MILTICTFFKFHCDSINIEEDKKIYEHQKPLNSTVILLICTAVSAFFISSIALNSTVILLILDDEMIIDTEKETLNSTVILLI